MLYKEILDFLKETSEELCHKWDCSLIEFGGEEDHIHLLVSCHPSLQMSIFVNNLKTVTSRLSRKKFAKHFQKFYWKPVLWTRAYCLLTTGGATIETIKKYIENQGRHSSPSNLQNACALVVIPTSPIHWRKDARTDDEGIRLYGVDSSRLRVPKQPTPSVSAGHQRRTPQKPGTTILPDLQSRLPIDFEFIIKSELTY